MIFIPNIHLISPHFTTIARRLKRIKMSNKVKKLVRSKQRIAIALDSTKSKSIWCWANQKNEVAIKCEILNLYKAPSAI